MTGLQCYRLMFAGALLLFAGCPRPGPPNNAPPSAAAPLRVMVVDDPPLAAALAREWLAHTETKIDLVEVSADKAAAAEQLPVDVVIYPPLLLGQFAARELLLPLDEQALADPDYARREILPALKEVETTWGRRTMAVPLGSPQLALWYRADLLAEKNLQPPKTWAEYATTVAAFAEKPAGLRPDANDWQALAEPLADGWAARLLLARAAAAALHRDQLSPLWNLETMEPLIAGPPWVRALEQLATDNRGSADPLLTPTQCYEKLQRGECAFAIGWPGVATESDKPLLLKSDQIGVAPLPGSSEMFQPATGKWESVASDESLHVPLLASSGRVASVTRASAQPKAATQFVLWLGGPTVSGRVSAMSAATTIFRTSHFQNGGSWQAPAPLKPHLVAYGALLFSQPEAGRRSALPRIPGAAEYLTALDRAVLATMKEEQTAEESLKKAAEDWRAITDRRRVQQQRQALRRSLGLGE